MSCIEYTASIFHQVIYLTGIFFWFLGIFLIIFSLWEKLKEC